jgi:hypothetical protein
MPMMMAKPANKEFPGPTPSVWYICVPNSGKMKPKKLERIRIKTIGRGGKVGITHFRKTVEADETLAAYVNASTRYKMMGRLAIGSAGGTQIDSSSPSVQAGHKAKTEYASTDYWHDPMELRGRGPSVPTVKAVNNRQTYIFKDDEGHTEGRRG